METAVWVTHEPADVARLFRVCLCRAPDGLVFELPLGRFAAGDRVLTTS